MSATIPLKEATEVIYEAIDKRINELVEQYQNLTTQKAECENLMKEKTIISTSQISGYKIQLELINRDIKFIEKAFLGNKLNLDEEIRELNMTRKRE